MRPAWEKMWVRFAMGATVVVALVAFTAVVALARDGDDLPGPGVVGERILDLQSSPDLGHGCTLIGCSAGIDVVLKQLPTDARTLEFCKESKCVSSAVDWRRRLNALHVSRRDAPGRPLVTLWILDERGRVLGHASARPALRKRQPNGPDCPPPCWIAWLGYDGDENTLTQIPVPT
jgi:hypothetical protein